MRRAGTPALAAVLALGVAGCGGGKSDKEKIETTIRDYFTAFADDDFGKACNLLTKQAREDLTKAARAKDCSAALARGAARADVKRFRAKLRDARVVSVNIKDKSATAEVSAIGATTAVPLVKEGGEWKVQGQAVES